MPAPIYILSGVEHKNKMPEIVDDELVASLFNVPALLQGKVPIQNANAILEMRRSALSIIDSGGKQIAEVNYGRSKTYLKHEPDGSKPIRVGSTLHLSPEHLAQAVRQLTKVDILMVLDDPVAPSNNSDERDRNFRAKLQRNVAWAQQTIELRDRLFPHVQIFLPIQCQTLKHFDVLWGKVESLGIDGLSLPQRCFRKAEDLIPFLGKFHDIGVNGFHFLGSSRLEIVALLCFLGRRNIFDHIGFDSTSWLQAAIRGKLILPYSLTELKMRSAEFAEAAKALTRQHKIYSEYGIGKIQKMASEDQRRCLRTLNYWAINTTKREIYKHAQSAESICKFLTSKSVEAATVNKIFRLLKMAETV